VALFVKPVAFSDFVLFLEFLRELEAMVAEFLAFA